MNREQLEASADRAQWHNRARKLMDDISYWIVHGEATDDKALDIILRAFAEVRAEAYETAIDKIELCRAQWSASSGFAGEMKGAYVILHEIRALKETPNG